MTYFRFSSIICRLRSAKIASRSSVDLLKQALAIDAGSLQAILLDDVATNCSYKDGVGAMCVELVDGS